jgi:hypothetical protein
LFSQAIDHTERTYKDFSQRLVGPLRHGAS